MTLIRIFLLTFLASLLAANALADRDCSRPSAPVVPDGAEVSEGQLVAAQKEVKEYVAQGQYYLKCLKAKEVQLGEDISEEQQSQLLAMYNELVDEMKSTSDEFNQAVRDYQSANG